MSKRKVDPMAQAIRDLKYLPRVLSALKALRAKDAEVLALVRGGEFWHTNGRVSVVAPVDLADALQDRIHRDLPGVRVPGQATLDTPERQEYEAAKREGRTVQDPFADPFRNATPEQRERMAEQRAAIAAEKARRGLTTPRIPHPETALGAEDARAEVVVSTEELATGANGSFGAAVSVTATDERLSPEESDG